MSEKPLVMAKVTGGTAQSHRAATINELKDILKVYGYTSSVNGEPASDGQELVEGDFVTFSQAIKGGV